jgi:hypothetical protein
MALLRPEHLRTTRKCKKQEGLLNTDEWLIAWFLVAKGSSAGAPLQRQYLDLNFFAESRDRTCASDWGSLGFFENQDVLQWQCLQRLQVCKPDSFHLCFDLLHGHLVHQFNVHIGILLAVFDKDYATAGLQGLADFGHDFKGVG